MSSFTPPFPLRIPVLLTAFSRYDTAREVMEGIREAKPPRLYFACDGPRNAEEKVRTDKVRSLLDLVDWPCEVKTLFREENAGLKKAMIGNIDWFFEHESEGVVLEDDTRPVPSFFWFAQEMLEKFRDTKEIWWILGNNLLAEPEPKPMASYYFSQHGYGAPWGWAGWRRSWKLYDGDMSEWPKVRNTPEWNAFFLSRGERTEAYGTFEATWDGTIKTWDFQHDFCRILHRGITVIPEYNLVRNIGFSGTGTNTLEGGDPRDVDNVHEMPFPLVHPEKIVVDEARDLIYFDRFIRPPFRRRLKNTVMGMLPDALERVITPLLTKQKKG